MATAWGTAPAARISAIDSRAAVPADITSSTISTRPCRRRSHQRAAFAVVLGFLAVVGERHVAAHARKLHGQRCAQGNALVGGTKDHVEFDAAGQQGFCIELREPSELGAIVEQTGVEK